MLICRPYITVKGKRIYAKWYGKKAFCFHVDDEKPQDEKSDSNDSDNDTKH
ncbi:MAG: hypothetical protein AAGB32_04555 [Pseudomonadota bacterium]